MIKRVKGVRFCTFYSTNAPKKLFDVRQKNPGVKKFFFWCISRVENTKTDTLDSFYYTSAVFTKNWDGFHFKA